MYDARCWFVSDSRSVQEPAAEALRERRVQRVSDSYYLGVCEAVDPSAQATIFTLRCVVYVFWRCNMLQLKGRTS